jgi:thiol-disulfide isomerase/thioredoxin
LLEIKTEEELNRFLNENKRLTALFIANWCPFCRSFRPIFESEIEKLKSWKSITVILDDDSNPLWDLYDVEVVPTVIYFQNGKIEHRLNGTHGVGLDKNKLIESFKQLIEKTESSHG